MKEYPKRVDMRDRMCECGHDSWHHHCTLFDNIFRSLDQQNGKCIKCLCPHFTEPKTESTECMGIKNNMYSQNLNLFILGNFFFSSGLLLIFLVPDLVCGDIDNQAWKDSCNQHQTVKYVVEIGFILTGLCIIFFAIIGKPNTITPMNKADKSEEM